MIPKLKEQVKIVPAELVFTNLKPNQPSSRSFQVINVSLQTHNIVLIQLIDI